MGWVLSKLWKKKSTLEELEALESKLEYLSKSKTDTVAWQKKVLGYLVTYSIVLYLIAAVIVYFKFFPEARTRNDQIFLLLPFLVTPIIIFLLRKVLSWWYHRKVGKGEQQLSKLRERKAKILDEVMEKETYKVAKQILDKYAPHKIQSPPKSVILGAQGGSGVRGGSEIRRRPGPPDRPPSRLNSSLPVTSGQSQPTGQGKQEPVPAVTGGGPVALTGGGGPPAGRGGGPPAGRGGGPPVGRGGGPPGIGRGAPGPPLPRPILPRERGYMDKFVEYLVGDGPANRFALICRQCQSHNGMALRDEFEYIAYRCCYCYYWNPARKQRPVAPRLPDPTTAAAMSSAVSSSDSSDQSGPESANQSRRNSVSGSANQSRRNSVSGPVESGPASQSRRSSVSVVTTAAEQPVTIGGDEEDAPKENIVEDSKSEQIEDLIEKVHTLDNNSGGDSEDVDDLIIEKLNSVENDIPPLPGSGEVLSDAELSEGVNVIESGDGVVNESDNRMEVDS